MKPGGSMIVDSARSDATIFNLKKLLDDCQAGRRSQVHVILYSLTVYCSFQLSMLALRSGGQFH